MAEILDLNNVPKLAREKNLVVWFGTPNKTELNRLKHKIVSVETYKRETKLPIKLAFTLPIHESLTDEIRKARDHMAIEACRIIKNRRTVEGISQTSKVKRDVITYSILRQVSWDAFKEYKDHIDGGFFKLITIMVFSAFCLEAFLNHTGRMYFPYWMQEEVNKTPDEKLKLVLGKLELTPDFGSRPFQTFGDIFRFRNKIAHGKTEYLQLEVRGNFLATEDHPLPYSEWEELVSENNAEIFMSDTDEIVKIIHRKAGFKSDHFGLGSFSWETLPPKNIF